MEEIITIDLPKTKYRFVTEGLLFKMSIPDFGKLLKVIGEQADPYEKPAAEYYLMIRQAMTDAALKYGDTYTFHQDWQEPSGVRHGKDKHVNIRERYAQLNKKLEAAEKKWG